MGDADIVRNALGRENQDPSVQKNEIRLVYFANAKPIPFDEVTIRLYKALIEKSRDRAFSPFTVGELKVFLEGQKPGCQPAQIVSHLEVKGLLVCVSGKKTSRTDPPMRAVVRRPVAGRYLGAEVFVPPECFLVEEVQESTINIPVVVQACSLKTKNELELELARTEADYVLKEEGWNQQRQQLENLLVLSDRELGELRQRIEELEGKRQEQQTNLEDHLVSKPDGLDSLRHKRTAFRHAIDVYDEIAPLLLRS